MTMIMTMQRRGGSLITMTKTNTRRITMTKTVTMKMQRRGGSLITMSDEVIRPDQQKDNYKDKYNDKDASAVGEVILRFSNSLNYRKSNISHY